MHSSLSESPKAVNNTAAQDQEHLTSTSRSFGEPMRDAWLSVLVLCLMFATMLVLFRFPVRRMFTNVEVNYNEGWNAYRADMVSKGIRLYGAPPQGFGTATAYPPISFHLVSWMGNTKTFPVVGRLVSFFALLATGLFVGLIVRKAGGSGQVAVFSFFLYEIGIALLRADRIGMYDPQLLGEALSAAGLYFYVRDPHSKRLLCVSAAFFCLAGFTKHNLLAFPAAVAIDLIFRSWKAFFTWAGAVAVSAAFLTAATMLVDGRYFFVHLMGNGGGRTYSYMMAWSQFHHYAERFQFLLVLATAWSIRAFRARTVFVAAFVLSHGLAFLFAGGYGIDLNIFFNGFAAMVILCGLALSDMSSALVALRPGALNPTATMMFGVLFISIMIFVPGQLRRDRKEMRALPALEKEFQSAVDFLKAHPGPALCESHLLCYEAGKPFEFEPFSVRDQVQTGRLKEEEVLQLLRTHHFQSVEVWVVPDEQNLSDFDLQKSMAAGQNDLAEEKRFSQNFLIELLKDYQLSMRTTGMAIFTPK